MFYMAIKLEMHYLLYAAIVLQQVPIFFRIFCLNCNESYAVAVRFDFLLSKIPMQLAGNFQVSLVVIRILFFN